MSHASFLAAIRETPDDDAPRLVYADWLEDQGDSARAEFIRLQCQLARMDPDDPGRSDVQERVWALQREHCVRWKAELPELRGIDWAIYQRGFIEIIRARHYKAFTDAAAQIREATFLRGLVLTLVSNFKTFRNTECLAGLEYLNLLPNNGITPECVQSLARCQHLTKLRDLVLGAHGMTPEGARALANSQHLAGLRQLMVSAVQIGPQAVRALVESPCYTQLRQLALSYTSGGDEGIVALANSPILANLEFLDLYGNEITGASLTALAGSPHLGELRSLSLGANRFTGSDIEPLASLSSGLRSLALNFNAIGSEGAWHLAESPLALLRWLDLSFCRIGDQGAIHLAGSTTLRALTRLQLGNNGIADEGVKALANSPILAHVQMLTLAGNPFGDEGAQALACSPYLGKIRSLSLPHTGISEDIRQGLRERFRGVAGI